MNIKVEERTEEEKRREEKRREEKRREEKRREEKRREYLPLLHSLMVSDWFSEVFSQ